jgi:23S rRNA pseudouridine1911/1915/1917 synthase
MSSTGKSWTVNLRSLYNGVMCTLFQDNFIVTESDLSVRLDKLLCLKYPVSSRTYFQYLIGKNCVLVNGCACKKRELLQEGDEVSISFEHTPELSLEPEEIPLEILFEDRDMLIINKPAGMVVHPGPGHNRGTFVHALLFHCKSLDTEGLDPVRPGIVHRLDKDTSGILIAAKNASMHASLTSLFSERKIRKFYRAICLGHPHVEEIIAPIKRHPIHRQEMAVCQEGKIAHTKVQVIGKWDLGSFLQLELITGRTHQIRVHLKHIGCPILGDSVYGRACVNEKLKVARQLLHAEKVIFHHPKTNEEITICAPIPSDMQSFFE